MASPSEEVVCGQLVDYGQTEDDTKPDSDSQVERMDTYDTCSRVDIENKMDTSTSQNEERAQVEENENTEEGQEKQIGLPQGNKGSGKLGLPQENKGREELGLPQENKGSGKLWLPQGNKGTGDHGLPQGNKGSGKLGLPQENKSSGDLKLHQENKSFTEAKRSKLEPTKENAKHGGISNSGSSTSVGQNVGPIAKVSPSVSNEVQAIISSRHTDDGRKRYAVLRQGLLKSNDRVLDKYTSPVLDHTRGYIRSSGNKEMYDFHTPIGERISFYAVMAEDVQTELITADLVDGGVGFTHIKLEVKSHEAGQWKYTVVVCGQ